MQLQNLSYVERQAASLIHDLALFETKLISITARRKDIAIELEKDLDTLIKKLEPEDTELKAFYLAAQALIKHNRLEG